MHDYIHRLALAVALCLPLLAAAQAASRDPADPKAAGPALRYQSAFADYKPWQDIPPGDWRAVNDKLREAAGQGGGHAGHGSPAPAAAAAAAAAPAPVPAPKASAPAMRGHGHQRGHQRGQQQGHQQGQQQGHQHGHHHGQPMHGSKP